MRTEVVMNSSDFEILIADDVYLTFYDADARNDTGIASRVQIKLPEHIARKFKEELKKKV